MLNFRKLHEVFLLVENFRISLMVFGINLHLDFKQVLGVAQVGFQLRRHAFEAFQESGIHAVIGLNDGVFGVGQIVIHCAVVRVHHDFHRVADVIELLVMRLGEGVAVGVGVGVLDPEETLLGDHNVGILVQKNERRDGFDALDDVAPEEDAALVVGFGGEEDIPIIKIEGENQFAEQGVDGNAAPPLVIRQFVALFNGIIDFPAVIGGDGIAIVRQAVINAGLLNGEAIVRARGDVLDEPGHGFLAALGRGSHDHPVAVGVLQTFVDPVAHAGGQVFQAQLPGCQKHLLVHVVDRIAVHVHGGELVIGAQLLELLVDVLEHFPVPDRDIAQAELHLGGSEIPGDFLNAVFPPLHPVKVIGRQGGLNAFFNIRFFPGNFVGLDDVLLHQVGQKRRVAGPQDDEEQRGQQDQGPQAPAGVDVDNERHRGGEQKEEGEPDKGQNDPHFHKAGAVENVRMGGDIQERVALNPKIPDAHQEDEEYQNAQMNFGAPGQVLVLLR